MTRVLGIAVQIVGCVSFFAMITTICIENTAVFDPSFPVRALAGVSGVALVLLGGYWARPSVGRESNPNVAT